MSATDFVYCSGFAGQLDNACSMGVFQLSFCVCEVIMRIWRSDRTVLAIKLFLYTFVRLNSNPMSEGEKVLPLACLKKKKEEHTGVCFAAPSVVFIVPPDCFDLFFLT